MQIKLIILLMVVILFSGCTCHTKTVYIEKELPTILVPEKVSSIDINVTNECICGESVINVFNGIKALRNTENYCIKQLIMYNKDFVNESR